MNPAGVNPLFLAYDEAYKINRSVRLRSSATAYFNRTPTVTGNRQKWTWSSWIKRGKIGVAQDLFSVSIGTDFFSLRYNASDKLQVYFDASSLNYGVEAATPVFRDPAAFYHVVLAVDTTQATAANRVKLYVNNVQLTLTAIAGLSIPAQNYQTYVNYANGSTYSIGRFGYAASNYFDGLLSEIVMVDGQQLDPSSFVEIDPLSGAWRAKKYSGTYGTNGFYLNFSDNSASTATTIGKDLSGNSNNWTPNNVSVTAGVTYDSMLDVPTNWSDGGTGRGNYAVLNPLSPYGSTITDGNLLSSTTNATNDSTNHSTILATSGKWYAEFTLGGSSSFSTSTCVGVSAGNTITTYNRIGQLTNGMAYRMDGQKEVNSSASAYGATYTYGDVIGVALDLDASPPTVTFYKNNTSQGAISLNSGSASAGYVIGCTVRGSAVNYVANFGQRPFSYTPPTGFKAMNTQNMPEAIVRKGAQSFDATKYTGTGAARQVVNAGPLKPDLVWIKGRSAIGSNFLFDTTRGPLKYLPSDGTSNQVTYGSITSFDNNGFSLDSSAGVNTSGSDYIAWQWAKGATPGFDVVSWSGSSANRTIAHGLGVAPAMIFVKSYSGGFSSSWSVYHQAIGAGNVLYLDKTDASVPASSTWNATAPTSSVFSLGTASAVNLSGTNYIGYAFSEVTGFSKFGSYTGNASTDGPFVYCGFKPRWVMIKCTSTGGAGYDWVILDTARDQNNESKQSLLANLSSAEAALANGIDVTANGFKLRSASSSVNASAGSFIFAAFAENPFKHSLAR